MTRLEKVYTRDGILALLKRQPCPRHKMWPPPRHECEHGGWIETIAAVHVLQPGEADWVWHRCPTRHQADA